VNAAPSNPLAEAEAKIVQLTQELEWAKLKIQVLEARLRLQRIQKYGPASEKLSNLQLELLEGEPGVSRAEVEVESQRGPVPEPARTKPQRNGRPHPGRQQLPADLKRVEKVVLCTPEQCTCPACGEPTKVIGYDESEQLDVEPAQYFVLVTKREKRACPRCNQGGVAAAPLPARIIEKSLVSDRVVIDAVVSKYCDHLPLYRQSAMLERETGLEISRATLDGWVMRVGELFLPMTEAMRRELLRGTYIQADETTVDVQMHDRRGHNHQAYLWQYSTPAGLVVFDFRLGRGRDGPRQFLGPFEGLLQTDGYAAYNQVGGPNLVHAGCWAHARRGFVDAVKLHPGDEVAVRIVERIDDLFAIDAEARAQNLDLAARDVLRQERARPLLELLRGQVETARAAVLPASALGEAAKYTLTYWKRLTRFLKHPELELSTNLTENSMRGVALGRKNWIHIGSPQAGPKVAAILSVTESCRRQGIPIRQYLSDVLPGLANVSIQRLRELTPTAWAAARR
jgi:transposase